MLAAIFVVSRLIYFGLGVRPDSSPLYLFLQYLDPVLLKHSLWESLFYLREQPPGFNLYLGLLLKFVGEDHISVFVGLHWLLGLGLGFSLFALMLDLQIARGIALLVTAVFLVSPITVLYENWLFYAFPVTALLGISAWALYLFLRDRRMLHAVLFFSCLFLVAAIRGSYHLVWFLLIAVGLLIAARSDWRKIVIAAGVPGLLLTAIYVKSFVMFGDVVIGAQVFAKMNYAAMVQAQVNPEFLRNLVKKGTISPILLMPAYVPSIEIHAPLVPRPALTGHPALDQARKTGGAVNWNSVWMARIGEKFYRDARVVRSLYPGLFFRQLVRNVQYYFYPADYTYPFYPFMPGRSKDAIRLQGILRWYDFLTTGVFNNSEQFWYDFLTTGVFNNSERFWITWLVLPACLLTGIVEVVGWIIKQAFDNPAMNARQITILFALFNIGYCAAATILLSVSDQNRYRDEVSALYAILLGLLLNAAWRLWQMSRARPLPSH